MPVTFKIMTEGVGPILQAFPTRPARRRKARILSLKSRMAPSARALKVCVYVCMLVPLG